MGKIHSIESMGLMDGPGIRMVVFFQGCPLNCSYCHNPDSQKMCGGIEMTSDEIVKRAISLKPYFRDNGGVTISGGEPLLQADFLIEVLKKIKKEGIHTALDTSGYGDINKFEEILEYTDLVLLDIKHFDEISHKKLTSHSMRIPNKFIKYLIKTDTKVWIRHVMVPTFTDNKYSMYGIFKRIEPLIKQIEKIEILPYHTMGVEKYKKLNLDYKLKNILPMDKDIAKHYENILLNMVQYSRQRIMQ